MRRALGVALVIVFLVATPAAATHKAPVGLRGCRFLAYSYDPQYRPSARIELARIALLDFKNVKNNPALTAIVNTRGPSATRNADLAAWCKGHYPNDPVVRDATWPTRPTS